MAPRCHIRNAKLLVTSLVSGDPLSIQIKHLCGYAPTSPFLPSPCLQLLAVCAQLPRNTGERQSFLQSRYRELNREFFGNSLPLARIEWADLTSYNRLGETYREDDGTFVVLVDRKTNTRDEDLQDTVFHEMCHVATWMKEFDPHGLAFRACMAGIKGKVLQDGSLKLR